MRYRPMALLHGEAKTHTEAPPRVGRPQQEPQGSQYLMIRSLGNLPRIDQLSLPAQDPEAGGCQTACPSSLNC